MSEGSSNSSFPIDSLSFLFRLKREMVLCAFGLILESEMGMTLLQFEHLELGNDKFCSWISFWVWKFSGNSELEKKHSELEKKYSTLKTEMKMTWETKM
ncbi:hypothetical protein C1645_828480 [Glomus cerebriforme]|uniref:Uncharacterized protein n=1 Tax=Glomus cerebriforme TaxID=658196 RepID=A0A397SMQ8_9GLOM|nr:hypothetical protein C1645_828480 [Glomus cerebriforme]